jgi:hypothetical protein
MKSRRVDWSTNEVNNLGTPHLQSSTGQFFLAIDSTSHHASPLQIERAPPFPPPDDSDLSPSIIIIMRRHPALPSRHGHALFHPADLDRKDRTRLCG